MNLKIRAKLLGSFLITIILAVGVELFALLQMRSIYQADDYYSTHIVPGVYAIGQIQYKVDYYVRQEQQHILAANAKDQKKYEDLMTTTDAEITKLIKNYQGNLVSDAVDRQNINAIAARWQDYKTAAEPFLKQSHYNEDLLATETLNGDPAVKLASLVNTMNECSQYDQKRSWEQISQP